VEELLAPDPGSDQGAVGAEGAQAAYFHPAGLTGIAAAVPADADRLVVVMLIAACHEG
jgi:hypothetical protein